MGKRSRSRTKEKGGSKRRSLDDEVASEDIDDEIDAFHKQRDVVPLNIHSDAGESDDDNEEPVFDFKDKDDEGEDEDDDTQLTGLAAKIARQQKFLWTKIGGVEDEMHNEEEEDENQKAVWGRSKRQYYNADEAASSDEEIPAEEEAEVLRLQREKAKSLSMEDFGLEDISPDEATVEPTLGEITAGGKGNFESAIHEGTGDDTVTAFEEVKKDLNALSKEEQMDVVYSSAPELVGLLSELNDAVEELESRINPLLSKVKNRESTMKGGSRYLEVKQILLLAYCQAITFYLLLKSEGQPVRDHPVIARLVEIKSLLEKMKQLDENLPSHLEEILKQSTLDDMPEKLVNDQNLLQSDDSDEDDESILPPIDVQEEAKRPHEPIQEDENNREKHKPQKEQFGVQSLKMLKVRAALEEKLRHKNVFSSIASKGEKNQKHPKPVNWQLETYADFDDHATEDVASRHGLTNGHAGSLQLTKVSNLLRVENKRQKVILGDDDLPRRDDIGERRRKHELQVLAGAGVTSEDDLGEEDGNLEANGGADSEDSESEESADEFYKQVKQQRAAKLAAKAEMYSRNLAIPSLPETVDGKRLISYQMEKNRGLTRNRKKQLKNPRKKYRSKHEKAVVRRKGQVREIRKPSGPYGGEASGINAGISRSVRFKS
ncbi:something about silencing protein 10 [Rhodamnia argentea]|uniref:Something about silencing protein 10 n=1 Tax=Rhodamnia argentea TaxID=178133 RepID=A0A8B8PP12_9MYRT|nr:something about silencing protein 10 [Rhodamnia argentea]XP_030536520.2 something about silencing protein 10 [Rhodamnia argentea]XP_030536521.2 something about silencing protein 10 [Rhodamnia argentea]XP_030536522.2 something about silencing protein 10 [Rhodamnia argentea]